MGEWVTGTMLWINLNSQKTTDWWKYVRMRTTRSAGVAFQTYVIRNQDDYGRTESDRWWALQSNVHGVVIAANDVPKGTIHEYPRTLGTVIEHFIPGLIVAESDFESAEHIDIMQFLGKYKRIIYLTYDMYV